MEDKTYNGWNNYETWVAKLWMDNDQSTQEAIEEMAQEELDSAEGDKEEAAQSMATRLESMHDEALADIVGVTGVFSDLLQHALGRVDWREIAENILADVDYTAPETDGE
jgi:hypothetical protein